MPASRHVINHSNFNELLAEAKEQFADLEKQYSECVTAWEKLQIQKELVMRHMDSIHRLMQKNFSEKANMVTELKERKTKLELHVENKEIPLEEAALVDQPRSATIFPLQRNQKRPSESNKEHPVLFYIVATKGLLISNNTIITQNTLDMLSEPPDKDSFELTLAGLGLVLKDKKALDDIYQYAKQNQYRQRFKNIELVKIIAHKDLKIKKCSLFSFYNTSDIIDKINHATEVALSNADLRSLLNNVGLTKISDDELNTIQTENLKMRTTASLESTRPSTPEYTLKRG